MGALITLAIIFTYILLWHFTIPRPDSALISEVLGENPQLMYPDKTLSLSTSGNENNIEEMNFFAVIAHRGAGLDAPENSLSAFRQCHERGCRMVEFDVAMTADDVAVLFHDDTVDRLTHSTGVVQNMTWAQLQALDISQKHPLQERFVGERVALFKEAVQLCLELDIRMIIDIKEESLKMVQVILDMFKEYPQMYKRAMVSGFNPVIIYMIRSRDPRIVCSLAWRPHYYACSNYGRESGSVRRYKNVFCHVTACLVDLLSSWMLTHAAYHVLGLSAVLLHKDALTWEVVSNWEKKNVRVIAWTVNRPQEKQFISRVMNVAYITDTLAPLHPFM